MKKASEIKVLVIDDDLSIRFSVVEFLKDCSFVVLEAESGEEALSIAGRVKFDVMIVDIRLPGIFGDDLIREMMRIHPACRVIIYTGSVDFYLPQDLIELGISNSDVYVKPIKELNIIEQRILSLCQ